MWRCSATTQKFLCRIIDLAGRARFLHTNAYTFGSSDNHPLLSACWPEKAQAGNPDISRGFLRPSKCPYVYIRARYTFPRLPRMRLLSPRRSRRIFLDVCGTSDDTSASPLKISSPMARPSVQMSGQQQLLEIWTCIWRLEWSSVTAERFIAPKLIAINTSFSKLMRIHLFAARRIQGNRLFIVTNIWCRTIIVITKCIAHRRL